jgi:lycopene beta-cyclase
MSSPLTNRETCDVAIVGGGLAGGLIALALAERRPDLDVRLIESGPALGGNHVWSFFASDVAPEHLALVEPLIAYRWDDYDIAFPAHRRTLDTGYRSITSERFDAVLRARLGGIILDADVAQVEPDGVTLSDGRSIAARGVIDTRGPGDLALLDAGWQKFVGRSLIVPDGHGVTRPVVMDATVQQIDGYRFVYLLPFSPTEIFVEDTYYSDSPALDVPAIHARIDAYAAARGWRVTGTDREEKGVLPVTIGGDFSDYWASTGQGAKAGGRAGLFHPTTGYSLPDAVRMAHLIAEQPDLSSAALERLTERHARSHWNRRGFYRMLDAMLFRGAAPEERYKIMQRFYRLRAPLIERFYAGRSTLADKLRVLTGKPPIPVSRGLKVIWENRK